MKRKLNKRSMVLLISLSLVLAASVGATVAFVLMQTETITNIFAPSTVSCAVITEHPTEANSVVQNVRIQNTGDTDAFIRVTIVVTWKNQSGAVYAMVPSDADYQLNMAEDPDWFRGEDSFWYYAQSVDPEAYTDCLISSCLLLDTAAVPQGYQLSVEVVASAIQATSAAVDDWSTCVTIAEDGTLMSK